MRGCNHSFAVKGWLIRGESSLSCHAIIKTLYDDRSRMTTFKRKGLINVDSRSDIRFWAISVMGRVALIILLSDRERACHPAICVQHAYVRCVTSHDHRPREKLAIKGMSWTRQGPKAKTLIVPIYYSHLRRNTVCVSKRLSRSAKAPFPTSGQRYVRMMPPLSWWRTSENLPKSVTSVQRTVTEDFSED